MPNQLTPYLISEFKSGISTYLSPWIRPQDAFEPLINAYVYRGVVSKRAGYKVYGANRTLTITGISIAASAVITANNVFTAADYGVTQVTFSGVVGMTQINGLTGTVQSSNATTFTVNINSSGFSAYGSGGLAIYAHLLGNPVMGIMRYVDESTGIVYLLIATTTNLYLYNAGTNSYSLIGPPPTFTGNITNFFNWTNWQAITGATAYLYMTNNVDNIVTWDGSSAGTLVPVINGSGDTITKALDVVVYKQRLLLIRPTLSTGGTQNQSIYWSKVQNTAQWRVDIAGQGGNLDAPTSDIIQSAEFIRDVLVVFFSNSTWIFRYTGNDASPFQWVKVSNTKSTTAPYASVAYDERCTSMGNTGFIACDGVNVQRYDIPIIDYYETKFSEQYYAQAFSQRYDNLNQSWTLYVSNDRDPSDFPLVGGVAPGSDSALIYNFLENTWATYTWSVPMTCLGLFYNQSGTTWADLNISPENLWENEDAAWNSYSNQKGAPILLAGDTSGNVYWMDHEPSVTDNGTSIIPDITTTRWNPVLQLGQKVQFAYIDIYYYVASTNPSDPISVTLKFYVDNSNDSVLSRTLTLDGPPNSEFAFKRIYVNLIGQFIQMEIDPNVDSFMQFLGFILWCSPAGRMTKF